MTVPYHSTLVRPTSVSNQSGSWAFSNSSLLSDVQQEPDRVFPGAYNNIITYGFPDTSVPIGSICMGVEVVVGIVTSGDSAAQIVVERINEAGKQFCEFPRNQSSSLFSSGSLGYHSIFLSNKPFERVLGPDSSWSDTVELSNYGFGLKLIGTSGSLDLREIYIRIYHRSETDFDAISSRQHSSSFQFLEVEGIRYHPTDKDIFGKRRDVGDYYFGWERLPCQGTMKTLGEIRSGKIDFSTGVVQYPSASISLVDVDRVSFEDGHLQYNKNGFFSWLTCFSDRENFYNSRLVDDTSSGYQTIKGLNPQDDSNNYGRRVRVEDVTGSPVVNSTDSYIYIGKEAIWYGTGNSVNNWFGSASGAPQASDIARGQFSSDNDPHIYNKFTGVYPEVSSHPQSWAGRIVRIWTIPYDPATGFPMPIKYGTARSYIWATHENIIAPGESVINVSCSALRTILDKKLVTSESSPLKNISLGSWRDRRIYLYEGETDTSNLTLWSTLFYIDLDEIYRSVEDIVEDINSNHLTAPTKVWGKNTSLIANWSCHAVNGKILFKVKGKSTGLTEIQTGVGTMLRSMGPIPGGASVFTTDALEKYLGWSTSPSDMKQYDSSGFLHHIEQKDAWPSYLHRWSEKLYVDQSATENWSVSSNDVFTSTTGSAKVVLRAGGKTYRFPKFTSINNDGYGYYYDIYPGEFWPFESEDGIEDIGQKLGKKPIEVTQAVFWQTVESVDILLCHLVSKGYGTGTSGYDALPQDFSVGLNESFVNYDSFDNAREYFNFFGLRTFSADDSMTYKELLEKESKLPVPIVFGQDRYGRFAMIEESSQNSGRELGVIPNVSDDHILRNKSLSVSYARENIVNRFVLKCDYSYSEDEYKTTLIANEPNSIKKYGERSIEIESRSIRSNDISLSGGGVVQGADSLYSGFISLCRWLFYSRAWEVPTISCKLSGRGLSLYSGQPVFFSTGTIQDITNSLATGMTNKKCQIVKIDKDATTGECGVQMVFDRFKQKTGGWAPSLRVVSQSGADFTVGTENYVFANHVPENMKSSDLDYYDVGDVVVAVEYNDLTPAYDELEISSINSVTSTVTMNTTPTNSFSEGDVIVFADRSNSASSQLDDNYVIMSDSTGWLDAGSSIEAFVYGV